MKDMFVTDAIRSVGAYDAALDLFENQFETPLGISYNSYLILDEKVALLDTVDFRGTDAWLENLARELNGRAIDYLVVHHMEPDHGDNVERLCSMYPGMQVVGSAKAIQMVGQFFDLDLGARARIVCEGDELALGRHRLRFFAAPMVHWPEVMVSYEPNEGILFSADAFGKFGAPDFSDGWADEARRYYYNIVGKYGPQVQALLKKIPADARIICSLHGPVIRENTWSRYAPERSGVLIAYGSMHGNTARAAKEFAGMLRARGVADVREIDLSRTWVSEALSLAFQYDRVALFGASYNAGLYPPVEEFLHHLKSKAYQKRRFALVENGSWAPSAGRIMRAALGEMKEIGIAEPFVSIRSALKADTRGKLETLADNFAK